MPKVFDSSAINTLFFYLKDGLENPPRRQKLREFFLENFISVRDEPEESTETKQRGIMKKTKLHLLCTFADVW